MKSIVLLLGRLIEVLLFFIFIYLFDMLWSWSPMVSWARGCAYLSLAFAFLFFFILLRQSVAFSHWRSPYFLILFLSLGALIWGLKFIRTQKAHAPDYFKKYSNCRPWTSEIVKADFFENKIFDKNPKIQFYAREIEEFCRGGLLLSEYLRAQAAQERPSFCENPSANESNNACFLRYVHSLYKTVPASSFARFYSMGLLWKRMNGVVDVDVKAIESKSKEVSFADRAKKLIGVQAALDKMTARIEAMVQGKDPSNIEFNYQKDVWEPFYEAEKSRFLSSPSIKWIYEQLKGFESVEVKP